MPVIVEILFSPKLLLCMLLAAAIAGCGTSQRAVPEANEPAPSPEIIEPAAIPDTPREMRGAWVASVANIDWPSEPGLPAADQKAELRAILDRAAQLNLNAIFLQVRPAADALYDSPYEPWSEFLTGMQGRPPQPYYDPLAFAVKEAHARGLQLHAWFNPFRAYHYEGTEEFASLHIKNRRPEWVVQYGRYWWLDPGREQARAYTRNVILDVARRYDIDGVHLDDYFYPYPVTGADGRRIQFPDDESYQDYVKEHGAIERDEWRRQNINRFVEQLYKQLKNLNPKLRFGISPFGIWRPGHPPQIKGFDAYAHLYADARKWLIEGWVDYLSPQLYWPVDQAAQSFPVLLQWWQQQNTYGRPLWPGLYTSRAVEEWSDLEISRQVQLIREQMDTPGHIHFSIKALMNNNGNIANRLLNGEYEHPALVPAAPDLINQQPPQPEASLEVREEFISITLNPAREITYNQWVLKVKYGNRWQIMISPGGQQRRTLPVETEDGSFSGAVVSGVNDQGVESAPQLLLPQIIRE